MYEKEKVEKLLNAIEAYMNGKGLCRYAYDNTATCLKDDCRYCGMARAYIEIRRPKRSDDEVQKM